MQARVKPRLRGVSHEVCFYGSLVLGLALVSTADAGRARLSATVFAACVAAMFGASALYHRPMWTPRRRAWLVRVDHAAIYLLIAGTYTPFGLLVLSTGWAIPVLSIVWGGALAAIVLKLCWVQAPKWLSASIAVTLGWVAVVAFSELLKVPLVGLLLLIAGGVFYTAGAVIYARRRPDPWPAVFGYHEIFHALVIAAAACQYASIAFYVLPRA